MRRRRCRTQGLWWQGLAVAGVSGGRCRQGLGYPEETVGRESCESGYV